MGKAVNPTSETTSKLVRTRSVFNVVYYVHSRPGVLKTFQVMIVTKVPFMSWYDRWDHVQQPEISYNVYIETSFMNPTKLYILWEQTRLRLINIYRTKLFTFT